MMTIIYFLHYISPSTAILNISKFDYKYFLKNWDSLHARLNSH